MENLQVVSVCRINNECVKNREARIGIDLVKDEVENSLEREVENIKTYQQRMQKMLARVNQQIETNHSMQVTSPTGWVSQSQRRPLLG